MLRRKVVSYAVPLGAALAAFLHAHVVGGLIDGTTSPAASVAPFAEARAAAAAQHDSVDGDVWPDIGAAGAIPVRATFHAIWIGGDRVWLSCSGSLCEARVLARPASSHVDAPPSTRL